MLELSKVIAEHLTNALSITPFWLGVNQYSRGYTLRSLAHGPSIESMTYSECAAAPCDINDLRWLDFWAALAYNATVMKDQKQVQDIVDNLRTRAAIRRSIPRAKDGKPDRISDVCEQAADEIVMLRNLVKTLQDRLSKRS